MVNCYPRKNMLCAIFLLCAFTVSETSITAIGRILNNENYDDINEWVGIQPEMNTTPPRQAIKKEPQSRLEELLKDRFVRDPIIVVVDRASEPLSKTKQLWRNLKESRGDNIGVRLGLITYSNMGRVNQQIEPTNLDGFITRLESIQPYTTTDEFKSRGAAYYTILKATEQVPFDGAIILFTGTGASDENLAQLTAETLVKKRCKLHVVWCGQPLENLGKIEVLYRDVANYTGGKFLLQETTGEITGEQENMAVTEIWWSDMNITSSTTDEQVTLAVRRNIMGRHTIYIPVDTTVEKLNIVLLGSLKQAVLQDPKGNPTDLLSQVSVQMMDPSASFSNMPNKLQVRLNTVRNAPGIWPLTTLGGGGASERYDVIVTAASRLTVTATINKAEDSVATGNPFKDLNTLKLTALGDVGKIDGVTLLDETGQEVVRLKYEEAEGPSGTKELYVSTEKLPDTPYYLKLTGQDSEGTAFTRVSHLTQQGPTQISPITVDVSTQSTLTIQQGQAARIIFTITNNQPMPMVTYFGCRSPTLRIQVVDPQRITLPPQQSVNVLVIAQAYNNVPEGVSHTVTFSAAIGPYTSITRQAIITTGVQTTDNEKPTFSYTINTDCKRASEIDCQRTVWSMEATMQDRDSGLIQVISRPQGVLYRTAFVAGTKEPVTVYYSATCCNSKVDLIAVDARGNYNKQTIDIYAKDRYLNEGEIAAIVLGVLLLLIIVALIILAIIVCRRRRSASFPQTAR